MLLHLLVRRALTLLPCIRVTLFPCSLFALLPCFLVTLSPSLSAQVGKVGINTTTPAAMLHVMDSSVLFTGPATLPASPGAPPVSGPGTRMMWYPEKAAFRAGRVTGTQWDKDSVGIQSAAFGLNGRAIGANSFIGGGSSQRALGAGSFVGGGENNRATSDNAFVGGGDNGRATGASSFVGGGDGNTASGLFAFAGGGSSNSASGNRAFVGGGSANMASSDGTFVAGGLSNEATATNAFIGGGQFNTNAGFHAFLAGGEDNTVSGVSSFVGGGTLNTASGNGTFVGGGASNTVSNFGSFVGGGEDNISSGNSAFVGGGTFNSSTGIRSFVGGGGFNTASGGHAFVGGGQDLFSESFCEAVFGLNNTDYTPASTTAFNANDRLFVIGNGTSTSARSNALTVLKNGRMGIGTDTPDLLVELRGDSTSANAATLALGGKFGDKTEAGRIRFLDGTASTNWRGIYMHHDGETNKFHIGIHNDATNSPADDLPVVTIERSGEQVGIGTTSPTAKLEVNAEIVKKTAGGSWTASSDRRLKQDIGNYSEGLQEVMAIRPVTFRYNDLSGHDTSKTHIGVIAQELQEVAPYMVSEFDQNGSTYLQVDNSAMTYMLINAVKEQQAIIEELKRTIETLSAEMAEVKARATR